MQVGDFNQGYEDALPKSCRILRYSIDFRVPGFDRSCPSFSRCLAPSPIDSRMWYYGFVERVREACGARFLPICRLSDGEFRFLLGPQLPSARLGALRWTGVAFTRFARALVYWRREFRASSAVGVCSGRYTATEILNARKTYSHALTNILADGLLAPHLSYCDLPFQEEYFPAFGRWLTENRVFLTLQNYIPFYFVYAAVLDGIVKSCFENRRIMVVTSLSRQRAAAINRELLSAYGAKSVDFVGISKDRSLFDNVQQISTKAEICLVAAGVGKPMIISQLRWFRGPVIDVGFALNVIENPKLRKLRPMMCPDNQL